MKESIVNENIENPLVFSQWQKILDEKIVEFVKIIEEILSPQNFLKRCFYRMKKSNIITDFVKIFIKKIRGKNN